MVKSNKTMWPSGQGINLPYVSPQGDCIDHVQSDLMYKDAQIKTHKRKGS